MNLTIGPSSESSGKTEEFAVIEFVAELLRSLGNRGLRKAVLIDGRQDASELLGVCQCRHYPLPGRCAEVVDCEDVERLCHCYFELAVLFGDGDGPDPSCQRLRNLAGKDRIRQRVLEVDDLDILLLRERDIEIGWVEVPAVEQDLTKAPLGCRAVLERLLKLGHGDDTVGDQDVA